MKMEEMAENFGSKLDIFKIFKIFFPKIVIFAYSGECSIDIKTE